MPPLTSSSRGRTAPPLRARHARSERRREEGSELAAQPHLLTVMGSRCPTACRSLPRRRLELAVPNPRRGGLGPCCTASYSRCRGAATHLRLQELTVPPPPCCEQSHGDASLSKTEPPSRRGRGVRVGDKAEEARVMEWRWRW